MGLTVHYTLKSSVEPRVAKQVVRQMREIVMDLPFEQVGDIVEVKGEDCDFEARRDELQGSGDEAKESLFWLLIQATKNVKYPWNKKGRCRKIHPERIIGFDTVLGNGCEPANFGLCLYPDEVTIEYRPEDDERFQSKPKKDPKHTMVDDFFKRFDHGKWRKHCEQGFGRWFPTSRFTEMRKVKTGLDGWHWSSFCKTQYASDPKCGGVPNFLKCHVSLITALDRMAKIPSLKVYIADEGKYGPHTYCPDWQQADKEGRKRKYLHHKGNYSPSALAEEVGEWNSMIAGMVGALGDALKGKGMEMEAPIKDFQNFEQLEFRGQNQKYLTPFLQAMKTLAVPVAEGSGE